MSEYDPEELVDEKEDGHVSLGKRRNSKKKVLP